VARIGLEGSEKTAVRGDAEPADEVDRGGNAAPQEKMTAEPAGAGQVAGAAVELAERRVDQAILYNGTLF